MLTIVVSFSTLAWKTGEKFKNETNKFKNNN
jgi:hypothetical protein